MPIGKNSIKRVANNGYSKVVTSAPDMENSVALDTLPVNEAVTEEKTSAAKKTAVKKTSAKSTDAKKTKSATRAKSGVKNTDESKKAVPVPQKAESAEEKGYCNFGDELPVYLL